MHKLLIKPDTTSDLKVPVSDIFEDIPSTAGHNSLHRYDPNTWAHQGNARSKDKANRREPVDSSETTSDMGTPPRALKRENAVVSPAKPQVGFRRLRGSGRSPRSSPLAQNRSLQPRTTRHATTKRMRSMLEPSSHTRQPLTPLRPNGTSSNELSSGVKGKSKASTTKNARVSLKPHAPVIAVDIMVFDEGGHMLTQERRLSHTEIQANQALNAAGKSTKKSKMSPPSPPPVDISDESELEETSREPAVKRLNERRTVIIISSDESEADDKGTVHKKGSDPLAKSKSKPESLRVEVVIPSALAQNLPNPSSLALAPPTTPVIPVPPRHGRATIPSLLAPLNPPTKPRQLTPIRGSSKRSLFRHPPPTPSTPTEADLSLDLAQLNLSDTTEINGVASTQPEYLLPLLNECAQTCPYEFSAFIETFPFDPIVQSSAEDGDAGFRKIGEASYSEVFGIGDVVLKIIPIRSEEELSYSGAAEMPAPSDAKDVLKEILVTREIGEICDKFVKLLKAYVVRGRYPSMLLDLWDEYNKRKGSESIRPDSFGLTQIYAIIILPNGGPDLESFVFKNVSKSGWHQACGIFWQVARALERVEHLVNFEHRDLHWGQVLVRHFPVKKLTSKCPTSRVAMDDTRFGVQITIIDLGLSRMSVVDATSSDVYWTPFDDDIFEGEGDYQYDIYRMMKDLIGGAWKSYHPFTNAMWLHYLVTKLLHEKRLKPPSGKRQGETRVVSPTGYDERECYDCLVEMETLLGSCIASVRKGQKARRKMVAPPGGPKSAKDVIAYGVRQGWVR